MPTSSVTVQGTLQPDGVTLHLERKLALPPGRVTVTVQPTAPARGPTMLEVLDCIHRDQQQRGRKPITEEDMAAEIAQMRAEDEQYEQRWRQIWSQTGTPGKEGVQPLMLVYLDTVLYLRPMDRFLPPDPDPS
jgi:hypothetical protein